MNNTVVSNLGAILTGTLGDYLCRTKNGLAIDMGFFRDGARIAPRTLGETGDLKRVAVFVHGIMCTEAVWRFEDGTDYGTRLAADLGLTPLYVRYNTGRRIEDNGEELACLLDALLESSPGIEEIVLVGYSMGGLLTRSACRFAEREDMAWRALVERCVYIGTPHGGAPAERFGRTFAALMAKIPDPYTRAVSTVGNARSQGIKDLGDGDVTAPLAGDIDHCLIAGRLETARGLFGDSVVPVLSATNGHSIDGARVVVLPNLTHVDLAHHADVYTAMHRFLEQAS